MKSIAVLALAIAAGASCQRGRKVDPEFLKALDIAYNNGVLTREEYEAKRREALGPDAAPGKTAVQPQPPRQDTGSFQPAAAGWTEHQNPAGFRVQHPAGWQVEATGSRLFVIRSADESSFVLITPFIRNNTTCTAFLQESLQAPSRRMPGLRLEGIQQRRQQPDEAVASFSFRGGQSRGAALCSLFQGSGMVFLIAAPAADYDGQRQQLVRILQSFTVAGGSGGGGGPQGQPQAAPAVQYVQWSDPAEQSFTLEAPAGWRVSGGLLRRSSIDIGMGVRISSPDGATLLVFGDPELRPCITPDALIIPMPEGQLYNPGYGTSMLVARFQSGVAFAGNYLQRMAQFASLQGVQIRDRRDRPDIAQASNSATERASSGEIAFSGVRGGQPAIGSLIATTTATPMPRGAIWQSKVMGYVTPESQASQTIEISTHLVQSFRFNPQWAAMQQRLTGATSGIVADTSAQISRIYSQSYWSQQNTYSRVFQRQSDATLGYTRLTDPNTGQQYVAAAGKNYYYLPANSDQPIGTNSTDRPNIDATLLLQVR